MSRFARHAVCSPLTLASAIGLDVLRDGGNAVDAAIATNLALAVAYPHMCGVGGDLLAMVWADGALAGLNSSGRLPAAAALPPEGVPERGVGSATLPGAPAGWRALAARFGTRPLRTLAAPLLMLMIDPPFPCAMRLPMSAVRRKGPLRFTPSTLSHSSSVTASTLG